MTFATFMLTGGSLADKFGRKRFFIAGLVVFSLGSLLCGLATNMSELIVNWQSIFFINVPIGIAAVVLTYFVVQDSRDTAGLRRIDPGGAITGTLGLFFLVYATIEGNTRGWTDNLILGSYALAAIFLAAFIWVELHRQSPMLPLSLFRNPTFSASIGTAIAVFFALFGMTFFISLYPQNVVGYDPVATGIRMVPFTVMLLLIAPVAGRLSDPLRLPLVHGGRDRTAWRGVGDGAAHGSEVELCHRHLAFDGHDGGGHGPHDGPAFVCMGSVEPRRGGVAQHRRAGRLRRRYYLPPLRGQAWTIPRVVCRQLP